MNNETNHKNNWMLQTMVILAAITTFRKILLLLIITVFAQAIAEPQVIHLQKGNKHIALFGTIHIAKPDFYPLPKSVLTSLETADALAVEMDTTDSVVQNETVKLITASAYTEKTQPLTAKQRSQIKHVFGAVDTSLAGEPWFLSVMISLQRANQLGFTETGIDESLIALAKQQDKKVISLERPDEQIGIFNKIPQKESLQLFDDSVSEEFVHELALTEKVWRDNDEQSAEILHKKMQLKTPVLHNFINTERNKTMAIRIIDQSETYPHLFVAIGAMHLYGEGSVVELLINSGFKPAD